MINNIRYLLIALNFLSLQSPKIEGNSERLFRLKNIKASTLLAIHHHDFKNAHIDANLGFSLAKKNKIDSLMVFFDDLDGYIYSIENNYKSAISKYEKVIIYYSKNGLEKKLAYTFLNIGICEKKLSRFETANEYYLKAADKFFEINDISDLADAYNSIGLCFLSLNNLKKSKEYQERTLTLRLKIKNENLIAQSYNNLGYLLKHNQPDSAIFYLKKSLYLYQKQPNDSSLMVLPQQNLGSAYKMKRKFILAERYIKRSLNIAAKYNMQEERAEGELDLCEILIEEMKYSAALVAANITEKIAAQLKLKDLLMQTYADKSSIFTKEYNYKQALRYQTEKDKLKDSIFSVAKDKAINELEIKYQTDLKNKDIVSLNLKNKLQSKTVAQQKLSIVALVTGAVLLLLLFGIAYRAYRQKASDNKKIQHLMQELHHRVKNNLQIMSGLFEMQINSLNDEATKSALRENETRLASMNLIHSVLYQRQSDTNIEMEAYLTKLLQHIQSSFGGGREQGIQLRFDVEPLMVEADKAVSIGLIVNELATNAFKYAFDGKKGEIYLGLKQESKGRLLLSLGDNGKGMNTARKKSSASFGLKLVNLLAKQLGAVMHIQNENGTLYRFEIYI